MKIVCKNCENIQEKITFIGKYSYKFIDGKKYIKLQYEDWKLEPKNICNKCGKEIEIEIEIDYSKINFISNERNDPNHSNYWQNGKTNNEIANVLADDNLSPY